MKRMIPAVFIAVAAALVCFFLARHLFVEDKTVQRARLVTPIVHNGDDEAGKSADTYSDNYIETSFITLAQDETLLSTVTMDIDGDGYDDQINVVKTATNPYIVLLVGLYNPEQAKYERVSSVTTLITQVRTFVCTSLDVIGNHHNALVYQGVTQSGRSVLRMFLGARKADGSFGLELIGDFNTDGTIFIQQLDRDESYELSLAKGQSFPVWVYSSESVAGTTRTDQIQTEFRWNEGERKYVQSQQTRVPGSSIAAAELARIQDGTVETFARFLDGLWYKTENAGGEMRYIFFDSSAHEIIFEFSDSEEVYAWLNSNLRRGGMYFTAVNTSIENLQRRVDISLVAIDEIRVRLQDDVRMLINESSLWDGSYKKLTARTVSETMAARKDPVLTALLASSWKAADGTVLEFADGAYTAKTAAGQNAGRFMVLQVSGTSVLQFRSDTGAPYFKENYIFGFQTTEVEETVGRRTVKKMVDDKNTMVLRHVVARPDGYYPTEERPLVLSRIE